MILSTISRLSYTIYFGICGALLLFVGSTTHAQSSFDIWNASTGDALNYYFGAGSPFTSGWTSNPCQINTMNVVKARSGNMPTNPLAPNTLYIYSGTNLNGVNLLSPGSCVAIVGTSGTTFDQFWVYGAGRSLTIINNLILDNIINTNIAPTAKLIGIFSGKDITMNNIQFYANPSRIQMYLGPVANGQSVENVFIRNSLIDGQDNTAQIWNPHPPRHGMITNAAGIWFGGNAAGRIASGLFIDNTTISNGKRNGITVAGSRANNVTISNSIISGNMIGIASTVGSCIRGGLNIQNTIINHQTSHGLDECIYPLRINQSIIAHNAGPGIWGQTFGARITNTQFFNNGGQSLGIGQDSLLDNVLIYNNGGAGIVGGDVAMGSPRFGTDPSLLTTISNTHIFNNAGGGIIATNPLIIDNSSITNNSGIGLSISSGAINNTRIINNESNMNLGSVPIYGLFTGRGDTGGFIGGLTGSSSDSLVSSIGRQTGQIDITNSGIDCYDVAIPFSGYYSSTLCDDRGRKTWNGPLFPDWSTYVRGYKLQRQTQPIGRGPGIVSVGGLLWNPLFAIAGGDSIFPVIYQPPVIPYDLSISGSFQSFNIIGQTVTVNISYQYSGFQTISGVTIRTLLENYISQVTGNMQFSQTGIGPVGTNFYDISLPSLAPGSTGFFTITGVLSNIIPTTGLWLQLNTEIFSASGTSISGDIMLERNAPVFDMTTNNRSVNTLFIIDEDIVPDEVSFIDLSDTLLNTFYDSNTVIITGLNTPSPTPITISGDNNASFRIFRGMSVFGPYSVGQTGYAIGGDIVQLRMRSASTHLSGVSMTMTMIGSGPITTGWTITTMPDNIPDLSFTPVSNAILSSGYMTTQQSLTGTQTGYWIQITGGQYMISGGSFGTSGIWMTGAVYITGNEQLSIIIQGMSASGYNQSQSVLITVGDLSNPARQVIIPRSITTQSPPPPPSGGGGGGGGGGGSSLVKDICPDGDYTASFYDKNCGKKPVNTGLITTDIIEPTLDISPVSGQCMIAPTAMTPTQKKLKSALDKYIARQTRSLTVPRQLSYLSSVATIIEQRIVAQSGSIQSGSTVSSSPKTSTDTLRFVYQVIKKRIQTILFWSSWKKGDIKPSHIVSWLGSYDITSASSLKTFNRYGEITREEAAKFYTEYAEKVLCLKPTRTEHLCQFPDDLKKANKGLMNYITRSCMHNIFRGYKDTLFGPKDKLLDKEAITALTRLMYGQQSIETLWRRPFVQKAISSNIIVGVSDMDNTYPITRGEVGTMMMRAFYTW